MKKKIVKPTVFLIILSLFSFGCFPFSSRRDQIKKDYIILLHGLARTKRSMVALQNRLSDFDYEVINIGYPSTKMDIYRLEDYVKQQIDRYKFLPGRKVHFVSHSMGGIIVRLYLKKNRFKNPGRVVMVSPPNQGSELADFYDSFLIREIFGPSSKQLKTDLSSLPNQLGAVSFELGVIAGDQNINPFYKLFFSSKNDGKVSVKRTGVAGMKDFLVVHRSHQNILFSESVIRQIVHFLENGRFYRDGRVSQKPLR